MKNDQPLKGRINYHFDVSGLSNSRNTRETEYTADLHDGGTPLHPTVKYGRGNNFLRGAEVRAKSYVYRKIYQKNEPRRSNGNMIFTRLFFRARGPRATCYTPVPPAITSGTTAECHAGRFKLFLASFKKKFHLRASKRERITVKRKRITVHRVTVLFRALR
jgi:hypothetical protein